MSETSERFQRVADGFSARVAAVPAGAWDQASPCEGWSARDVVAHVIDAAGRFLSRAGVQLPAGPTVAEDPVGAWEAARAGVLGALTDPEIAARTYKSPMGATMTLEQVVGMFGIGDVLVHTWDLARATGLDERLDPQEVSRLSAAMEPNDEMMRQGTAFGPKVEPPPGADEQTRLLCFTGRRV
jgi:uncharacterized protein (TIGR03086 family)